MVKDGEANDELEKFRLNFSRCANRNVTPLIVNKEVPAELNLKQKTIQYLDVSLFNSLSHSRSHQNYECYNLTKITDSPKGSVKRA